MLWSLLEMHEATSWGPVTCWLHLLHCMLMFVNYGMFSKSACILNSVGWCWCEPERSNWATCVIQCSWRWFNRHHQILARGWSWPQYTWWGNHGSFLVSAFCLLWCFNLSCMMSSCLHIQWLVSGRIKLRSLRFWAIFTPLKNFQCCSYVFSANNHRFCFVVLKA